MENETLLAKFYAILQRGGRDRKLYYLISQGLNEVGLPPGLLPDR